jgi:hypothetical protein
MDTRSSQKRFDDACTEALLWLWRGDGLRAHRWLTLASAWLTTDADCREFVAYAERADRLCDPVQLRQYWRGALVVPLQCAPLPLWLKHNPRHF